MIGVPCQLCCTGNWSVCVTKTTYFHLYFPVFSCNFIYFLFYFSIFYPLRELRVISFLFRYSAYVVNANQISDPSRHVKIFDPNKIIRDPPEYYLTLPASGQDKTIASPRVRWQYSSTHATIEYGFVEQNTRLQATTPLIRPCCHLVAIHPLPAKLPERNHTQKYTHTHTFKKSPKNGIWIYCFQIWRVSRSERGSREYLRSIGGIGRALYTPYHIAPLTASHRPSHPHIEYRNVGYISSTTAHTKGT